MLRQTATWGIVLTRVGNLRTQGRQLESIFRYYVLQAFADEGLLEYLREPRTCEDIRQHFGFEESEYLHGVLDVMAGDKPPILHQQDGHYRINPDFDLRAFEESIDHSNKNIRQFSLMAKGMAQYVLPRLRNERIEFPTSFKEDGRQLLTKFDMTLGSDVYAHFRSASFALLTGRDRARLRGKQLLEVGCGSGRETAELWLRYGGNIHITAIDPVESLLNLARERFPSYLDAMQPGHPPLTAANRPSFYQVDVTKLPFEDNTFDAAFHAFVLHWTPDPAGAIREIVRVLKPGGLVFGVQPVRPAAGAYFDLVVRTSDSFGFFWKDDLRKWYADKGVTLEIVTPLAVFRGHKPNGRASGIPQEKWESIDAWTTGGS